MRAGYKLGRLKGRWVVKWVENGNRRRYRLRAGIDQVTARAELERFVLTRKRAIINENATVGDVVGGYIRDRKDDRKRVVKQEASWKALAPFFEHLAPSEITKDLARRYEKHRLSRGRQIGTVCTELSVLRAALNWGVKEKLIKVAPHVWLPAPPPPKNRHLTRDEWKRFETEIIAPHFRVWCHLALGTAGRAQALLDLTWARVDFDRRIIDLGQHEGENNKRRAVVPMTDTLRDVLIEAKDGALTDYVVEFSGSKVGSIKKAFILTARRAGIADASPNVIRHTSAVWMAEAGVPMSEISQYLGHSSTAVTERVYARYSPNHLRRAAAALDPALHRAVQ